MAAKSDPTIGIGQDTGDRGVPALCVRKDTGADIALADGKYAPPQLDSSGNLRVRISAGATTTEYTEGATDASITGVAALAEAAADTLATIKQGQQTSANSLSTTPATDITDATYIGDIKFGESLPAGTAAIGKLAANSGVDIGDVDVLSIAAGDNNIGNVDIASIAAGDNNIGNVDIVSGTITTVTTVTAVTAITNALPSGTNAIGKLAANSGVDIGDVDVTSIAAGTNKIGDVDIAPRTTGGWSVGNFTSGDTYTALTSTAQVIKASAGKFGGYYIYNPNSSATYVLVYNIAAESVTVGTSTASLVFAIPATSAANLELIAGIPFGTAMSIAAATTGGGNTAPTTALEAMIWYV